MLRSALPATGGFAAIPAGTAFGAEIGGPFAEFTGPAFGLAAAMGAGGLIEHFQGKALEAHWGHLPPGLASTTRR